ncbi:MULTISPECIES: hypothetical protein [Parachlamydia]|jgi:hypothetical protein|uniref:hypothetical protein n=1 Tax=Parachlamydia TaxID=83551 RepID=UPI0001C17A5C|nr:hypothetical protein [Parachlamydia acanthamoebae]EFB42294.1 hypothetical protein pah_c013o068 [Parachlamydia acanthamoebae str. Hall's coccus]
MKKILLLIFISVFSICSALTVNHFDDYQGKISDTEVFAPKIAPKTKMYINDEELETNGKIFRLHTGDNIWISVPSIHSDQSGLFVYENEIIQDGCPSMAYQNTWKCPYCYRHWPIGKPCQNPDCPSKYK